LKKPNLFIVGFQKCGSSSLFELLSIHPAISFTSPKETYFLTDPQYDNYDSDRNIQKSEVGWGDFVTNGNGKYLLEGTVANFYQECAFQYISSLADRKVIFLVRNPVDRFVSNYKYYYGRKNGIKAGTTIEKYFRNVLDGEYQREALKFSLLHGEYSTYINKWTQELGSDSVHTISFEQLIANPDYYLKALWTFLELEPIIVDNLSHKNQSKVSRFPKLHEMLVSKFGGSILSNNATRAVYSKLFPKKIKQVILSDALKKELTTYYGGTIETYKELFFL